MASLHLVPPDLLEHYEWLEWRNAVAVLQGAHPQEWADIVDVLRGFTLPRSQIVVGGGSKSLIAAGLDGPFATRGWREKSFRTRIAVDDAVTDSPTHSVDCYKSGVAIEVEWNNKDTFYDRDLNNFRLLFDLRVIEVGVVITRQDELQPLFRQLLGGPAANSKFGATTTHISKLVPKLEGGGGGGCPVVVIGIGLASYDPRA